MKTITYNPETHALVPREPTRAMCDAALAFDDNKPLNDWGKIVPNTYEETYSAMLAAAPQPEPVDVDPASDLTLTAVECIKKLKAENESLKRDAERLDFILRKQLIVIQDCDDKYFTYNAQSGKRGPEMDSEAEAIDAAMAQGDKP